MEKFVIEGGYPLSGTVVPAGNKNAALPALAACLRRPQGSPDHLGSVRSPVLVVLGDRDFAGPADQLVEALADARLAPLPGVDHFATPKAFAFIDAALRFLESSA